MTAGGRDSEPRSTGAPKRSTGARRPLSQHPTGSARRPTGAASPTPRVGRAGRAAAKKPAGDATEEGRGKRAKAETPAGGATKRSSRRTRADAMPPPRSRDGDGQTTAEPDDTAGTGGLARRSRRPPLRRAAQVLIGLVVLAGALLLFVIPGRTLLDQNRDIAQTQTRMSALAKQNAALKQQLANLNNASQVEQIARQRYGYVMPGQTEYVVVPHKQAPAASTAPKRGAGAKTKSTKTPPHH